MIATKALQSGKHTWRESSLEDICELITDGTHQTPTYANDGVVFLSAKNVVSGVIDWGNVKYIPEWLHADLHKRLSPRRGDILLAKNGTTGVAAVVDRDDVFDIYVSLALLRPKESVYPRYLLHAINSPLAKTQFNGSLKGIGVPNLHLKDIRRTVIPLPPLSEQKRIAEILDRAEALRAKRRAALALLDELTQSIFLDMFGDPVSNPKGWDSCALSEICREISDINHKMPKAVSDGVPFISAKDLTNDGRLSFDDVKYISQADFEDYSRKSCPRKGDIIYSRIGVNLGKARVVEVDFPFLVSYSCCIIRPIVSKVGLSFLCHLMDSPFMLKQAHRGVRAIAVPDLGLGEIKKFRVILPPKELQQDFEDRILTLESLKSLHRVGLSQLDQLFASLQHRVFRGEL